MLLAQLGIETIPLLLAEIEGGWTLIEGESGIISHLEQHCVSNDYSGEMTGQSMDYQEMSELPSVEEDSCRIDVDCEDE